MIPRRCERLGIVERKGVPNTDMDRKIPQRFHRRVLQHGIAQQNLVDAGIGNVC